MARRFMTRKQKTKNSQLLIVAVAALCVFGMYLLYRWLVPFTSLNPLWQEATIGQTVLDDWRYAGQDAEGYLKFYNNEQTVLLPPNARLFDADGRFIVLEQHTPSSITYAEPVDAIPMSWLAGGAGLASVPILYVWFRIKSRGGFKARRKMKLYGSSPSPRGGGVFLPKRQFKPSTSGGRGATTGGGTRNSSGSDGSGSSRSSGNGPRGSGRFRPHR